MRKSIAGYISLHKRAKSGVKGFFFLVVGVNHKNNT